MLEAKIVYTDSINDVQTIEVGAHRFEFGGPGDGFCYNHQDFKCLDHLTPEESAALHRV